MAYEFGRKFESQDRFSHAPRREAHAAIKPSRDANTQLWKASDRIGSGWNGFGFRIHAVCQKLTSSRPVGGEREGHNGPTETEGIVRSAGIPER